MDNANNSYNARLNKLQKYLPALDCALIELRGSFDLHSQKTKDQIKRLESLHNILTNKDNKLKFENLEKVEIFLLKIQTNVEKMNTSSNGIESPEQTQQEDDVNYEPMEIPTERITSTEDSRSTKDNESSDIKTNIFERRSNPHADVFARLGTKIPSMTPFETLVINLPNDRVTMNDVTIAGVGRSHRPATAATAKVVMPDKPTTAPLSVNDLNNLLNENSNDSVFTRRPAKSESTAGKTSELPPASKAADKSDFDKVRQKFVKYAIQNKTTTASSSTASSSFDRTQQAPNRDFTYSKQSLLHMNEPSANHMVSPQLNSNPQFVPISNNTNIPKDPRLRKAAATKMSSLQSGVTEVVASGFGVNTMSKTDPRFQHQTDLRYTDFERSPCNANMDQRSFTSPNSYEQYQGLSMNSPDNVSSRNNYDRFQRANMLPYSMSAYNNDRFQRATTPSFQSEQRYQTNVYNNDRFSRAANSAHAAPNSYNRGPSLNNAGYQADASWQRATAQQSSMDSVINNNFRSYHNQNTPRKSDASVVQQRQATTKKSTNNSEENWNSDDNTAVNNYNRAQPGNNAGHYANGSWQRATAQQSNMDSAINNVFRSSHNQNTPHKSKAPGVQNRELTKGAGTAHTAKHAKPVKPAKPTKPATKAIVCDANIDSEENWDSDDNEKQLPAKQQAKPSTPSESSNYLPKTQPVTVQKLASSQSFKATMQKKGNYMRQTQAEVKQDQPGSNSVKNYRQYKAQIAVTEKSATPHSEADVPSVSTLDKLYRSGNFDAKSFAITNISFKIPKKHAATAPAESTSTEQSIKKEAAKMPTSNVSSKLLTEQKKQQQHQHQENMQQPKNKKRQQQSTEKLNETANKKKKLNESNHKMQPNESKESIDATSKSIEAQQTTQEVTEKSSKVTDFLKSLNLPRISQRRRTMVEAPSAPQVDKDSLRKAKAKLFEDAYEIKRENERAEEDDMRRSKALFDIFAKTDDNCTVSVQNIIEGKRARGAVTSYNEVKQTRAIFTATNATETKKLSAAKSDSKAKRVRKSKTTTTDNKPKTQESTMCTAAIAASDEVSKALSLLSQFLPKEKLEVVTKVIKEEVPIIEGIEEAAENAVKTKKPNKVAGKKNEEKTKAKQKKQTIEVREEEKKSTKVATAKAKARRTNELDRLNQDIDNMFIRDDVLAAMGRRMVKEPANVSQQADEQTSEFASKAMKRKSDNDDPTVLTKRLKPGPLCSKYSNNESDNDFLNVKIMHPDIRNMFKRKLRVKIRKINLENINQTESDIATKINERDNVIAEVCEETSSENKKGAVLLPNTNPNWHSQSKGMGKCVLCPHKSQFIGRHYQMEHGENYFSRLTPALLEKFKNNELNRSYFVVRENGHTNYCFHCGFCLKFFKSCLKSIYEHFSIHTGEYRFECSICRFGTHRPNKVLQHIEVKCPAGAIVKRDFPNMVGNILGHVCHLCNYVQLSRKYLNEHYIQQHNYESETVDTHGYTITLLTIENVKRMKDGKDLSELESYLEKTHAFDANGIRQHIDMSDVFVPNDECVVDDVANAAVPDDKQTSTNNNFDINNLFEPSDNNASNVNAFVPTNNVEEDDMITVTGNLLTTDVFSCETIDLSSPKSKPSSITDRLSQLFDKQKKGALKQQQQLSRRDENSNCSFVSVAMELESTEADAAQEEDDSQWEDVEENISKKIHKLDKNRMAWRWLPKIMPNKKKLNKMSPAEEQAEDAEHYASEDTIIDTTIAFRPMITNLDDLLPQSSRANSLNFSPLNELNELDYLDSMDAMPNLVASALDTNSNSLNFESDRDSMQSIQPNAKKRIEHIAFELNANDRSDNKYYCLESGCSFIFSNESFGLETHFRNEHATTLWSGYCNTCMAQVKPVESGCSLPLVSDEIAHMLQCHIVATETDKPRIKLRRLPGDCLSANSATSSSDNTASHNVEDANEMHSNVLQTQPIINNAINNSFLGDKDLNNFNLKDLLDAEPRPPTKPIAVATSAASAALFTNTTNSMGLTIVSAFSNAAAPNTTEDEPTSTAVASPALHILDVCTLSNAVANSTDNATETRTATFGCNGTDSNSDLTAGTSTLQVSAPQIATVRSLNANAPVEQRMEIRRANSRYILPHPVNQVEPVVVSPAKSAKSPEPILVSESVSTAQMKDGDFVITHMVDTQYQANNMPQVQFNINIATLPTVGSTDTATTSTALNSRQLIASKNSCGTAPAVKVINPTLSRKKFSSFNIRPASATNFRHQFICLAKNCKFSSNVFVDIEKHLYLHQQQADSQETEYLRCSFCSHLCATVNDCMEHFTQLHACGADGYHLTQQVNNIIKNKQITIGAFSGTTHRPLFPEVDIEYEKNLHSALQSLMRNRLVIRDDKLYACWVPNCNSRLNAESFNNHLLFHLSTSMRRGQDLNCLHCGIIIPDVKSVKTHLIQAHKAHNYICYRCFRTDGDIAELSLHYCQVHNKQAKVITKLLLPKKAGLTTRDIFVLLDINVPNFNVRAFGQKLIDFWRHKNVSNQTHFKPEQVDFLPVKSIFDQELHCAVCLYKTKVRTNLMRHLLMHTQNNSNNETPQQMRLMDPVNPVPCLQTKERHFDRMTNLASSSVLPKAANAANWNNPVSANAQTSSTGVQPLKHKLVSELERFCCNVNGCIYRTQTEDGLRAHVNTLHKDVQEYECQFCSQKVALSGSLGDSVVMHLRFHGGTLFQCKKCGYEHYERIEVERHTVDQHGDKKLVCKIRSLIAAGNQHANALTTETSSSSLAMQPQIKLAANKNGSGGGRNKLKLVCLFCKFKTVTIIQMQAHIVCHDGVKHMYKCKHCLYNANKFPQVLNHMQLNHGKSEREVVQVYRRILPHEEDELEETASLAVNNFTRPLWQRNDPARVRHIRGILMENEEEAEMHQKRLRLEVEADDDEDDAVEVLNDIVLEP